MKIKRFSFLFDPARQEGSIPLHQEDGQARDGLAPGLALVVSQIGVWVYG